MNDKRMKIFYPKEHYNKNYRGHVFPLLKPFLKNETFTDEERIKLYGISEKDFNFTDVIEKASLVILPMSWDYYLKTNQTHKAILLLDEAKRLNIKVCIVTVGDYGVKIPSLDGVLVFRMSGYRSKLDKTHFGIPVFIEDPLKKIYSTTEITVSDYSSVPIVGFCGQTNSSFKNAIKEVTRVFYRNIKYSIGLLNDSPQKIQSTSYNRSLVLSNIKKAKIVTANFIERKGYRAGVVTEDARKSTELEFYNNMVESNYIICVRGAGNFSVRLYETLAMGRVPVFVNTDCLLPLPEVIDWKKHMVWVEFNELSTVADKIVAFHAKHNQESFEKLQQSNRELWKNKLTLKGFFKSIQ